MPIKMSFWLVCSVFFVVPFVLGGAEPSAQDERKVRLALLRAVPVKWDLDANFKTFLAGVDLATEQKAELLITPECWLDGYASPAADSTPERIRGIAQDLESSPYLVKVSEIARKHGMSICFGFTSLENGEAYNAAGLWDSQGKRVGVYHKTHLQTHDLQYAPGQRLSVWPTAWGKVGMSLVTAPDGRVIAKANSNKSEQSIPQVMICDIDLSQAKDDNHLRDRRPEIYRAITEGK
jgi:predicted amidohydrolase